MDVISKKRHLTIEDVPQHFNENGEPLCRICKGDLPNNRRTFCSEQCVHEYYIRSNSSYARDQVFKRDSGKCFKCSLDTEKLKALLYKLFNQDRNKYNQLTNYYKEQYGFDFSITTHYWEMDHIRPVAEGGGGCGLDNLQTLCRVCHREKTKRQFRRAKQIKQVRALSKWQRKKQTGYEEILTEDADASFFED